MRNLRSELAPLCMLLGAFIWLVWLSVTGGICTAQQVRAVLLRRARSLDRPIAAFVCYRSHWWPTGADEMDWLNRAVRVEVCELQVFS